MRKLRQIGMKMEILIVISVVTSLIVVWCVSRFWLSLTVSIAATFTLWYWLHMVVMHPLTLWKNQYFLIWSVVTSAVCFVAVWVARFALRKAWLAVQRVRKA